MEVMVLVVLAAALVAVGLVVAAVAVVARQVRALASQVRTASARLAPLVEELQAEQATTELELDALQRRREGRSARDGEPRR